MSLLAGLTRLYKERSRSVFRIERVSTRAFPYAPSREFAKRTKNASGTIKRLKREKDDSEVELSDMSALPAGIDLYSKMIYPQRTVPARLTVKIDPSTVPGYSGHHVFAVNVPSGASESDLTRAVAMAGKPRDVFIFRNISSKAKSARSIKLLSNTNAILSFDSEDSFNRCTTTEAKLFGVLCKASSNPSDPERMMFLEPAEYHQSLLFNELGSKSTVESFQQGIHQAIEETGMRIQDITSSGHSDTSLQNRFMIVKFPCFFSAWTAFNHLRTKSSYSVGFNNSRTGWIVDRDTGEGSFMDAPRLTVHD